MAEGRWRAAYGDVAVGLCWARGHALAVRGEGSGVAGIKMASRTEWAMAALEPSPPGRLLVEAAVPGARRGVVERAVTAYWVSRLECGGVQRGRF